MAESDKVEVKSVELAEAKAGVMLRTGHRVVLVVNGTKGSRRYRRSGEEDAGFQIEITLHAKGGTPMAHERIRIVDPDTDEPVGEAVVTDEEGVLRATVPEEKEYHLVVEDEPAETDELPPLADDPGGHEPSTSEHSMLSVELLDAERAPLKGERVQVKGEHGADFEVVTDDEGCFHELAENGVYELTVRGQSFKAHTIFHDDREGSEVPYRFVLR
ncbi:MAG: hypothetical protein ACXWLR_04755 [Myxococcales bacterium]